jgi:hypothetical protein
MRRFSWLYSLLGEGPNMVPLGSCVSQHWRIMKIQMRIDSVIGVIAYGAE